MLAQIKSLWDKTKAWFKYSETIFLSRLTAFAGFVTAVLAGMDWSPIASIGTFTNFDRTQALMLGLSMLVQGITLELARRRNAGL